MTLADFWSDHPLKIRHAMHGQSWLYIPVHAFAAWMVFSLVANHSGLLFTGIMALDAIAVTFLMGSVIYVAFVLPFRIWGSDEPVSYICPLISIALFNAPIGY